MRKYFAILLLALSQVSPAKAQDTFEYNNEKFADLQLLRYKVDGFEDLSLKQKTLIYHLQEAALWGRDILFDQNGRYNLKIRNILEQVYTGYKGDRGTDEFKAFETYMKCVWFANGIHHHYSSDKFIPEFSEKWLRTQLKAVKADVTDKELAVLCPVIFSPAVMAKRVNQTEGEDLLLTSAMNYYQGVSQAEAEAFYDMQRAEGNQQQPVMFGMNSTLVKSDDGRLMEQKWTTTGKYGATLSKIVENLRKAIPFAEDAKQKAVIEKLIEFYETGDLKTFDDYSILWVDNTEPMVDFVNGFIESYGDPLGLKSAWESIINFKDMDATKRTTTLSQNAQWFEDNSPVAPEFRKDKVKGISAKVINAAILGGDTYPSSPIGINLPNSDWVRAAHGSKSLTIANLTRAYDKSAAGNGSSEEFVLNKEDRDRMAKYGSLTNDLHTDLHECLGHASGKLLDGVSGDALKAYGSTLEEARADLFALYYLADQKLYDLGITPDMEAYKAEYYSQMLNGLMTQLRRINLGDNIEEAHMRDRALIAYWCLEKGKADNVMELIKKDGKTYLQINDYTKLRELFGRLLAEIQRIKSTGDFAAGQALVENYGVKINPDLHREVLERYSKLSIAPYKGFINPVYKATTDANGNITNVTLDYTEGYAEQMLRYSRDYSVE